MTSAHTAAASLSFVQIDTATARELVSRGVSEGAVRLFAHLHVHAKQTGESRASHRYLWRCAEPATAACSFWRQWTPDTEPPPRCARCGGAAKAT
jgi:hypothetical protein